MVAIDNGPAMVSLNVCVMEVAELSLIRTVKLNVPGLVGMPAMPPAPDTVSPGGVFDTAAQV